MKMLVVVILALLLSGCITRRFTLDGEDIIDIKGGDCKLYYNRIEAKNCDVTIWLDKKAME